MNNNFSARLKDRVPPHLLGEIDTVVTKYNLNNIQLSHFLGQCHHESGGFSSIYENLNYSGDRLLQIFPKYFNVGSIQAYSRRPEKIANRVYSNRMGNGNESSGEGWKYRGRGFIQLTGKSNYLEFDKSVEDDIINNPDLVANKYPLTSAGFFFAKNGIFSMCSKDIDAETIKKVTRLVNGGFIGLEERIRQTNRFWNLLK